MKAKRRQKVRRTMEQNQISFIRSISSNSGNYDKNFVKIKFHLDNDLPLEKTLDL